MSNLYRNIKWKRRRLEIIEQDGYRCRKCCRSSTEVVLQVHHKRYIQGKFPWQYSNEDLITLCKGCHAKEHGILSKYLIETYLGEKIPPKGDWESVPFNESDLGDLIGSCEFCGTSLRYTYEIFHPDYGTLEVGTDCHDLFTGTTIALEHRRFLNREKNFIHSKKWKQDGRRFTRKLRGFNILIWRYNLQWFIKINQLQSTKPYPSLEAAKAKVFQIIEKNILQEYLEKNYRK